MQIAMAGLGRMGFAMALRLLGGGHEVVAFNRTHARAEEAGKKGAVPARTLEKMVEALKPPRAVWLMLPAGAVVDEHVNSLAALLQPGDLVVDGGNSRWKDASMRAAVLAKNGIRFADAGVSGGIHGQESGFCIMLGGANNDAVRLAPALDSLCVPGGWLHAGPLGSGHFLKMVHNAIEYGFMQSMGEGFALLEASPFEKDLDMAAVARLWNSGSVIRSWLMELAAEAFSKDPRLRSMPAIVGDTGEGRWAVEEAVERGVPAMAFAHSLFARFRSRDLGTMSNRLVAALRREFGGHEAPGGRETTDGTR